MADWIYTSIGIHFIRPWAWLLLAPLLLLFFWQVSHKNYHSNWASLIDQHLLKWILPHSENKTRKKIRNGLLLTFWFLLVAALSGPSWERLPQPIYSSKQANIIVLDLSSSMDAHDIEPSRLARAKFKLYDLLETIADGNTALIVYAGDAFILSPLTSDEKTIENLIRPLQTELMPIKGSMPQQGIAKAIEILQNANQVNGNIFWITDGAEPQQLSLISNHLNQHNYQLKILATGTAEGAPIKMASGRFLKDSNGNIVVPKLNYSELAQFAEKHGATLTAMTADNSDIEILSQNKLARINNEYQKEDIFADSWHDSGYWVVLLLLPLVLYSFRNKNLLAILLVSTVAYLTPLQTHASAVDKLFLNKDQQGRKHYRNGDLESAEQSFENLSWKAISAYRNGNYAAAAGYLRQAQSPDEYYNLGNALALEGKYQAAIDAYSKAIETQANHQDAKYNKKIIEDLLEQQQQESQSEQDQSEQQEQKEQDQQEQQEQNQQQQEQENQQQDSEKQEQEKQTQEQQLQQLSEQEKQQELEQWLKKISDDPGRLIRNKMKLEYNRRGYRSQPSKTW